MLACPKIDEMCLNFARRILQRYIVKVFFPVRRYLEVSGETCAYAITASKLVYDHTDRNGTALAVFNNPGPIA